MNGRKSIGWASKFVRLLAALFLLATVAAAHEGLHGQIAEVTARIKRAPLDANLYLRRGELYRLDALEYYFSTNVTSQILRRLAGVKGIEK